MFPIFVNSLAFRETCLNEEASGSGAIAAIESNNPNPNFPPFTRLRWKQEQ